MRCSKCNSRIPAGSKFCVDCGEPADTVIKCRECLQDTPSDSKFCSNCGATVMPDGSFANDVTSDSLLIKKVVPEKLDGLSEQLARVPYGFFALLVSNGQVVEIVEEGLSLANELKGVSRLISDLKQAVHRFLGREHTNPEIYLVADLNLLPVASYQKEFQVPRVGDVQLKYRFVFSRTLDDLSKLLGVYMAGDGTLSVSKFVDISAAKLEIIFSSMDPQLAVGESEWRTEAQQKFLQVTGLELLTTDQGVERGVVRTFEVGGVVQRSVCNDCGEELSGIPKFCEGCGSSNLALAGSDSALRDMDGNKIIARIVYRALDGAVESDVYSSVFNILSTRLKSLNRSQLMDPNEFRTLETSLNSTVPAELKYAVSDIRILDVRSEQEEWAFKTSDLIDTELRNAQFLKDRMVLTGAAEEDYQSAVFELALRKRERLLSEYRTEQQEKFDRAELDVEFYRKQTQLEEAKRDINVDSQKADINRAAELDAIQQSLVDDERARSRKRDEEDLNHSLKTQAAELDAELNARSQRHDAEIREKTLEQKAEFSALRERQELEDAQHTAALNRDEQKLDNESARDLKKLESMAELERLMAEQESKSEIDRIAAMKGMSPQEILAIQAAEISKQASPDSVASVVQNIAGNQSNIELYERLLEEKEVSKGELKQVLSQTTEALLQNNAALAESVSRTAESRLDGYKTAAESAKSTNEKSMESMAKVAASAAQRKDANVVVATPCVNSACRHKFEGKVGKFCPICGTAQG